MALTSINYYLINFLTTSLFLISCTNCLPQQYDNQNTPPEAYKMKEDLLSLAEDQLHSHADRLIRSPQIWEAEEQAHELLSMESGNSDMRAAINKREAAAEDGGGETSGTDNSELENVGSPTPCSNGQTICEEEDPNYPREYIKKILKGGKFREYFDHDDTDQEIELKTRDNVPEINNITFPAAESLGNGSKTLCEAHTATIFPKKGQSSTGNWVFFPNLNEHIQGVRIELCSSNSSCAAVASFPNGYTTACIQKHLKRKIVSIRPNGTLMVEDILLPSCCSCIYHFKTPTR